MKKKIIIIIAILAIALIAIKFFTRKNYSDVEITEIQFSHGGGYGTFISTATKTITFTPDGQVTLSNSYNSYTESFHISKSKYNELSNYILERMSLFDEKAKEEEGVMDGGSSYLTVKLNTGETKNIGGYMIKNTKFNEIKEKIYKLVDSDKRSQYADNIEKEDNSQ